MAKRPVPKYDFKAFGAAIKAAREGRKESRKKVGDEMFISPRYLANIENKGQHPSLQIFFELIQRYHISVDQFLLETPPEKNTQRRQLDALLDGMSDTGIRIVTATSKKITTLSKSCSVLSRTFLFALFFDFGNLLCRCGYNPYACIAHTVKKRVKLPPDRKSTV